MGQLWEEFSAERKALQEAGEIPPFMETAGYSMFVKKYIEPGQSVKDRYQKIAKTAGKIASELYGDSRNWEYQFFNMIWNGWVSPSTPILANLGTDRGMSVSCEGSYVGDSVYDFYDTLKEAAVLSQNGFGTSAYMGDIRPRGSKFSDNGKANGVVPIFENFVEMTNQISQGSNRRGSWAGYLEVDHDDFDELCDKLEKEPANLNIGWIITDSFKIKLLSGDKDALRRYQKVLKTKMVTGKGYLWFVDDVNRQQTEPYKKNGLRNKASNLCSEITLFSDEDHSYTCVLSSLNLDYYDEWKDTSTVFLATVFLDCIAEDFLRKARYVPGLERAVRYTEKARSLGLGVMGYHSYLQKKNIAWKDAGEINQEIFKDINAQALKASRYMAKVAGSPEWCEGTGLRNTHLQAIAPTMSTALIVGGTSQGIEPYIGNIWNQTSAAGEMARINPNLLAIMKDRGVYNQETIDFVIEDNGSVQNVDWLDDQEKEVFKTAYEIDQELIVKHASERQPYIDQGQSLNLHFDNTPPSEISRIHKIAMLDPNIKGLYYLRSRAGAKGSNGKTVRKENV
ncbi:ribonucleotide reductase [Rhodococcus phage Peregrin]|nr:ribonucleotide reductase [Rhodococcus phage Peregrin]